MEELNILGRVEKISNFGKFWEKNGISGPARLGRKNHPKPGIKHQSDQVKIRSKVS